MDQDPRGPERKFRYVHQSRDFRECAWPKSRYADGGGYLEIRVNSVTGPGETEAYGANMVDRIAAPCLRLSVSYQFGTQGAYENSAPFTVTCNTVLIVNGKPWMGKRNTLPFYPDEGEVVVIRNDHYQIASARCL